MPMPEEGAAGGVRLSDWGHARGPGLRPALPTLPPSPNPLPSKFLPARLSCFTG